MFLLLTALGCSTVATAPVVSAAPEAPFAAANQSLQAQWEGRGLDRARVLTAGEQGSLAEVFGVDAIEGGMLHVTVGLPPVIVDRDGEARLVLQEWQLHAYTPGGSLGEEVELVLGADVAVDGLSGARVRVEAHGASAELSAAEVARIEAALGSALAWVPGVEALPVVEGAAAVAVR